MHFYTHKTCPQHSIHSKILLNGKEQPRFEYTQTADFIKSRSYGLFKVTKHYFMVDVLDKLNGEVTHGDFHHKTEVTWPNWIKKLFRHESNR